MITDAQVHLWEASRPERPWAPGYKAHLPEPMTAERMLGLMDEAGVDRAIISPPSNLPDRNPVYAQEVAAKYPSRFRVMCWFWAHKHAGLLPRWLEQPGMCSLRVSLNEEGEQKQFAEGAFEPLWKAAAEQGIAVAVWSRWGVGQLEPVLQRYPGLVIIIDHFNWALPKDRERKLLELEHLARYPSVHVKVSSMPLLSEQAPPYSDLEPLIRRVHAAYGARRLMWGSDQTQIMGHNLGSYRDNCDIVRVSAAKYLPKEDIEWMLHGTAAKVFNWPSA